MYNVSVNYIKRAFIKNKRLQWANFFVAIITACAAYIAYVTAFKNGSYFCFDSACGTFFWGAQLVDGLWHIALIENAFNSVPFSIPILAGKPLGGYNYLLDLMLYPLYKAGFTSNFLYFKVLSITYVLGMLAAVVTFTKGMKKGSSYLASLLFFAFLWGNFYYMFALYHFKDIMRTSGTGFVLNLTNMQYSFSLITLLFFIHVLHSWNESQKKNIVMATLLALSMGLKFYAGMIGTMIFVVYYGIEFLQNKGKIKNYIVTSLITGGATALMLIVIYKPFSSLGSADPVFTFAPFAKIHDVIESPHKFYLENMVLARYTLEAAGWSPRLIGIEAFSTILFIFFEFGTLLIGVAYLIWKALNRKLTQLDVSLIAGMIFGMFMTTFFIQRGQWWNIIQFMNVGLFILSIYAASALTVLATHRKIAVKATAFLVVIITIPYTVIAMYNFSQHEDASYIPDFEMEYLKQLSNEEPGYVLTFPPRVNKFNVEKPKALWREINAPYVTVYSNQLSYLHAEDTLKILDTDFSARKKLIESGNIEKLKEEVEYVYSYGSIQDFCSVEMHIRENAEFMYGNEYVSIYRL